MPDNLDAYADVIVRLATETVNCSPPSWPRGALSIQSDGIRLTYQLKNHDYVDKAVISETLRDQIDELYIRMTARGEIWTEALLNWWRDDNELKYNIAFEYPKTVPTISAAEQKPKQPWWKRGHH